MNRRAFVALIGGTFAASLAFAQKAVQTPRVGLLWISSDGSTHFISAFRDGLQALGYADGKNIIIDDRSLVDGYEGLSAAAAKLAAEKVSMILAYGTTAVRAAYAAAPGIPIVMVAGGDPIALGVASSLARPGGNVTG